MKLPWWVGPVFLALGLAFLLIGSMLRAIENTPRVPVKERIEYYPYEGHCFAPSSRRSGYFDEIACPPRRS
jgi:hypothetical protein